MLTLHGVRAGQGLFSQSPDGGGTVAKTVGEGLVIQTLEMFFKVKAFLVFWLGFSSPLW